MENQPKAKKIKEVLEQIEQEKDKLEVMPTGIRELDNWLDGGFLRKELIVLGGHTGLGKSYVAGQFFYNIAKKGFKCAYFSLEISNEMIVSRLLGSVSNIKPSRIRMGLLKLEEFKAKNEAKAELEAIGEFMFFYDNVYTLEDILKEVRENKYEFVIVDFIQNVLAKGEDEYTRLSRAALELQKVAKEVNGAILAVSQLSNVAAREGASGKILEYKGSGSIATVCDLGFFLERPNQEWDPIGTNPFNLHLRKNRRGGSGMNFTLYFRSPGGLIYGQ